MRHIPQILGIFEGQDARKRDVKTQIQPCPRHLGGFGKAMEHTARTARRAVFALFFEQAYGVLRRAAGVDDERQLRVLRRPNVGAKTLALPFHVGQAAAF